jgi:hypothetical protein
MPLSLISGKNLQRLTTCLAQAVKGQVQSPGHRFMSP